MCDASAAVALTDTLLQSPATKTASSAFYHRDQAGEPVQSINLSAFLDLDARKPEPISKAGARGRPGVLDNLAREEQNGKDVGAGTAFCRANRDQRAACGAENVGQTV